MCILSKRLCFSSKRKLHFDEMSLVSFYKVNFTDNTVCFFENALKKKMVYSKILRLTRR
ncbi:ORF86 [Spodoptera exigua multiple nucleopolyhedrovirus]|uniref:ORF86 n=1 Tax=Spodoptera exigua nuclear polyhedrosis virus (strain US) TaxID=31506 RepID=Q9J851_NPVSE|nr:ORF86 [Spodoptera exigua multiple nucleopolyhedrovirus]AAF33615.1 ORF86 [Spodoptera exigua multiple nucleopolyhedrovirus]